MKLNFFARAAITALITGYFVGTIGPENLAESFAKITPSIVGISLAAFFAVIFFNSLNFSILFRPVKEMPLALLMKKYSLGWATGFFLPSKIGEFSLIYFLRKEIPPSKATAIVFLDKTVSLLVVSIVTVIGMALLLPGLFSEIIFFGTLLVFASLVLLHKNFLAGALEKVLGGKKTVKVVLETYNTYLADHKKILAINFAITLAAWTVNSIALFLIIRELGAPIGFAEVMFSNIATVLISLVPVTINGLGLKEGSFVFITGMFGLDARTAFAASAAFTLIGYTTATAILAVKTLAKGARSETP